MTGASGTTGLWAGLDIGGSKVHAVAVDDDGAVLAQHRAPTRGGPAGVVASAVAALEHVAPRGAGVRAFDGVGVGVPGLVDPAGGGVSHAVNLGLDGEALGLRAQLAEVTGAVVSVENDVNAAALGAARALGLAEPDLAYLSVGTGLAAGLVLGGRLRRGSSGAAGEVGHLALDPAGPPCSCGQRGCLEVAASGAAIARARPVAAGASAAQALWDDADAGDDAACRLRDGVVSHLAVAVRVLVLTVDVPVVVLGGGVAELGERLAGPVREHLRASGAASAFLRALDLPGRVVLSPPGVPVAAIGAALAGREAALAVPSAPLVAGGAPWRS